MEYQRAEKRESYHWYKTMREGEYEYLHEFKERINEIMFLQKKHHEIVIRNEDNPQIQQTSLAELHRLSITLSNLYDVAPTIIGVGKMLPYQLHQKLRAAQQQQGITSSYSPNLSILRDKPFWIWDKNQHYKLARESITTLARTAVVEETIALLPSAVVLIISLAFQSKIR